MSGLIDGIETSILGRDLPVQVNLLFAFPENNSAWQVTFLKLQKFLKKGSLAISPGVTINDPKSLKYMENLESANFYYRYTKLVSSTRSAVLFTWEDRERTMENI